MISDKIKRYLWLIDFVSSRGPVSKEEIDNAWNTTAYASEPTGLPRETFNRYRKAIKSTFDIDICCNRSSKKYYIKAQNEHTEDYQWLTIMLSLVRSVRESDDLEKRVAFETVPSGLTYLPLITSAMKTQTMLLIEHQSFHRTEPHSFYIQPYGLKQFKKRWYVVGYSDEYNEVRTFALDRISKCENTSEKWLLPIDFDIHTYFKPYVGVFRTCQPECIRLRATTQAANFLRSLPLHYTQQEIESDAEKGYSIFQYNVAPTLEFIQELRTFGADVRVISPRSLVDTMRSDLEKALIEYNENNE